MSFSRRNFLKIGGLSIISNGFVDKLFSKSNYTSKSKLDNLTRDVKPLTIQDYEKRWDKARRLMHEQKVDALLLMSGADLNYFTKMTWGESERPFGAILNHKGSPIWFCPAFEMERAKQRIPNGQEIRVWQENESPYKLIGAIMKDIGVINKRLALAPNIRSFISYNLRKDVPSIELVNGEFITQGCRCIKTEKEIEFLDLANKITKLAFKEAFNLLHDGMSTADLGKIISSGHQNLGANGGALILFGSNSAYPHGSSLVHNLSNSDTILCDGGCSVEGFSSDVTRTIVFGKPSDKQVKIWDIVKKAQTAALKAVIPGVTCESIDIAGRKIIEDAGYGPGYKYFTHRLGHGVGMEGHEYPYLLQGNKLELETGMTFSNEPGIYFPGEFGIRIEDCFVVTPDGGRFLGEMESTAIDKPFGE